MRRLRLPKDTHERAREEWCGFRVLAVGEMFCLNTETPRITFIKESKSIATVWFDLTSEQEVRQAFLPHHLVYRLGRLSPWHRSDPQAALDLILGAPRRHLRNTKGK